MYVKYTCLYNYIYINIDRYNDIDIDISRYISI
jgi:hypothetical protein